MSAIKELTEKLSKVHAEIQKLGKEAFVEVYKPLFEKHSNVESIRWTQYTPYFNDGESCEFGVNDIELYSSKDGKYHDAWSLKYYKSDLAELANKFSELHTSIDDKIFSTVFDDHVQVTISRDGNIEVEEYSHD